MRKVLSLIAAVGILSLGFAGIASAAADSWTILYTVGSGPGAGGSYTLPTGGPGAVGQFGVRPTATDGRDAIDGSTWAPSFQDSPALAAWYRPEWGDDHPLYPWAYLRDFKAPITGDNPIKVWEDFVVYAHPGYTAPEIHLFFYVPNAASLPPNQLGAYNIHYKLEMTHAPAGYDGPTEFLFTDPNPAGSFPNQLLAHIILPSAGAVGNPFNSPQTVGYRFNFITPEPASMMVLATGLTGLAGLISRRRRS